MSINNMAGRVIAIYFSSLEVRRQVPHFYFIYKYPLASL